MLRRLAAAGFILALLPVPGARADEPKPKPVSFREQIQPILKERCRTWHTGAEPSHNLVLDTPEDLFKGGDGGSPIMRGKSKDSLLYQYLTGVKQPKMPLNTDLTDAQIRLFQRWIDEGAKVDQPSKK